MTIPYVPGPERTDFRLAEITRPTSSVAPKRSRAMPVMLVVLALAVLFAGGVAAVIAFRPDNVTAAGVTFKAPLSQLLTLCHEQVLHAAKAPASVKFSDERTMQSDGGPGWWQVDGVIDGQNGFGALIRNRYTCKALRTPDGWQNVNVSFSAWN